MSLLYHFEGYSYLYAAILMQSMGSCSSQLFSDLHAQEMVCLFADLGVYTANVTNICHDSLPLLLFHRLLLHPLCIWDQFRTTIN
jgi:hypothetical protein